MDLGSIVSSLIEVEKSRHINFYETWKTGWEDKISALQSLNTKLATLHSTVKAMDTGAEFLTKTAVSSDEDVLTASASSTAVNGAYTVEVASAVKHRLGSDGKADSDTTTHAIAADQIDIVVGTNSETLTIDGGDYTLDGIAAEISSESSHVTAEVIDDGSGTNQYRLVLTANAGGSSNRITIGTNDTSIDFSMPDAGDRIDDPESTLSGTATVSSGGQYLGTTNKTFSFKVSGSGSYTVGFDEFELTWTDNEGNNGTVLINTTSPVDIDQGVTIQFSGGSINGGDTFSIDTWHPDIQAPQDDGLAKTEEEVHAGFLDEDTTEVTSSDGIFSYIYNGHSRSIDVGEGTTLSELVTLINSDIQNPGITARIVNDGTGLSTAYHLVLAGNSSGAAHKIESIDITALDNFTGSFSESQSAQNSMIKVAGYPIGDVYMQRETNTISDLISGVTLNLTGTGTSSVTVNTDTSGTKQNISDFVEAFNEVRNYIKEITNFDTNTDSAAILLGNYGVDTVKNRLNAIVSTHPPGFRDSYDTYMNLMQIGIFTDIEDGSETEGQLIIDDSNLSAALSSDINAVTSLFSEHYSGRSANSKLLYESYISGITEAGGYEISFNHIDPSSSLMRSKGGEWHAAAWDSTENTLTGTSGNPEAGLVVQVMDSSSSFIGEVDLKLGMAGTLKEELDMLTNPYNGTLVIIVDNYQNIIDNIDNKIDREEERISLYEQRLKARYSRLEALLTELNSQSSYLSSEVAKLN